MISDRLKLATTVAGAVTLAFGISLTMDWPRPYWAGLAVVVIGLSTIGESIFKGLQRLLGTVVAIPVAILFIDLFAQERWQFAAATSIWIGFCVWRMQVDKLHFYFWTCCGFIVPLLSIMSGFESVRSFYTVEARAQETLLGVLCFVGVALLLDHRSTSGKFIATVAEQVELLRLKVGDVRLSALGAERAGDAAGRNAEIARRSLVLDNLYSSAMVESFDIRARAPAWRLMLVDLQALSRSLDRLDLSFAVRADVPKLAPVSAELLQALDAVEGRLDAVAQLIRTGDGAAEPQPLAYPTPTPSVEGSPFVKGEVLFQHEVVTELDRETRRLYDAAADIADKGRLSPVADDKPAVWPTLIPDPEQMAAVLFSMIVFWLAFLLYIFVPGLPDGTVIVITSASFGINLCRTPWIPAYKLLLPIALASVYGAVAHIFVMPHLSGFEQLGTMLFVSVFIVIWLFHTDDVQVARTIGVVLFLMTIQVSNQQTYSATYVMNIGFAFAAILLLISLAQRWPISFKPEHVVARQLKRYGRSMNGLLDGMQPSRNSWWDRQWRGYYLGQLLTIPQSLNTWIARLPEAAVGPQDRQALFKLNELLTVLSYRAADLATLRMTAPDRVWIDVLSDDVRSWRQGIKSVVTRIMEDNAFDPVEARQRLDARLARLEALVAEAARSGTAKSSSDAGLAHMQRVLSAYRGVSFAVGSVARQVHNIAWGRLREERF